MVGKETWWEPHATFIFNKNGYLGEMKGKQNNKPVPRLHPYIVALLKDSNLIKGIVGGGYKPANNFKLSDLSPEMYRDLIAARPDLGSLAISPQVAKIIELLEFDQDAWNPADEVFVVQRWATGKDFLYHYARQEGREVLDLYFGEDSAAAPSFWELTNLLDEWSNKEQDEWKEGKRTPVRSPNYLGNFALALAYQNPSKVPSDFAPVDKDSVEELLDAVDPDGKATEAYFRYLRRPRNSEAEEPAACEALKRAVELYSATQPGEYDAESEVEAALEMLGHGENWGTDIEYGGDDQPVRQTLSFSRAKKYADQVEDKGKRIPDWDQDVYLSIGGDWFSEERYSDYLREEMDKHFGEKPKMPPGFHIPNEGEEYKEPWTPSPQHRRLFPEPEAGDEGIHVGSMDSSLLKRADVLENVRTLEAPLSKEHDLVARVLKWYQDNGVRELPWKDFQKKFPFAQNSSLFTRLRRNGPTVTLGQLEGWLETEEPPEKDYGVSYETYHDPEESFRDAEQLVLQINQGASAKGIMGEDMLLSDYVDYVGKSSEMSGHPVGKDTVGWLRLDFIDKDWLLVDEVQTDLINSVSQAKAVLEAETFEEFFAGIINPRVREKITKEMQRIEGEGEDEWDEGPEERTTMHQRYDVGRRLLIQHGYTVEEMERIRRRLTELFKDWAEYAISTLLEMARRNGIKYVAIHTSESIAEKDLSVEADKIGLYYDGLAKSFGFRKETVSLGGQQKAFWVRQASARA